MKRTLLIVGAVIAAFVAGVVFDGYTPFGITKAYNPVMDAAQVAPAPVTYYASRRVVSPVPQPTYNEYEQPQPTLRRHRTWEREEVIVAGSSGAGAAIGAAAGGGKGAGIGAVSGAVAGLVYDLATRDQ